MPRYKAKYKDKFGEVPILIENNYEYLTFTLEGLTFEGKEFAEMELLHHHQPAAEQLARFSFSSTPIYHSTQTPSSTQYALCDCSFEVLIPQLLIDIQTLKSHKVLLKLEYVLGKAKPQPACGLEFEQVYLSFEHDGRCLQAKGEGIDIAFEKLAAQILDTHRFKNCFGCLYADYSPYGNSSFGTMQCFVRQKKQYLSVRTKNDYLDKLTNEYDVVQEIYKCRKYKIRTKNIGYRG